MSLGPTGQQLNGPSYYFALSDDARYVAFSTNSEGLVPVDPNREADVFVRDRASGTTVCASVTFAGTTGNAWSDVPALSADGRWVSFFSGASDLVAGDLNSFSDVFVRDLMTGTTGLASLASSGAQGNGPCGYTAISDSGRYVAFESAASNLVPDDTNGVWDIFVRDRWIGVTTRATVDSSGVQADNQSVRPSISADGRMVAYGSAATNLVPGDTNGVSEVFVHDLLTGATIRASVTSSGAQVNNGSNSAVLSGDGRRVAFASLASDLVPQDTNASWDIFVHDLVTGTTERVSVDSSGGQSNRDSYGPALSFDGRYAAFSSQASNLVPNDDNGHLYDVFLRDLVSGTTQVASVDSAGMQVGVGSIGSALSADARFIAFVSGAQDLVPGDTNGEDDVFLHDREPLQCPGVGFYCVSKTSSQGCLPELETSGVCSASAGSGFVVLANAIVPNKSGLFFYSRSGPISIPFHGGLLCAQQPLVRTLVQNSAGSSPCSGTFSLDFNAWIASGSDPLLVAGAQFWGQYWYRDPQSASTTGLTHAVTTVICP